jgi:hypothetical protein
MSRSEAGCPMSDNIEHLDLGAGYSSDIFRIGVHIHQQQETAQDCMRISNFTQCNLIDSEISGTRQNRRPHRIRLDLSGGYQSR